MVFMYDLLYWLIDIWKSVIMDILDSTSPSIHIFARQLYFEIDAILYIS